MIFAYARISTTSQNIESQLDELKSKGYDEIFVDKISGKSEKRPELDKLLMKLRKGDTVLIYRLDRLGRSLAHLLELMASFEKMGVSLVSMTESIDTTSNSGKLIFNIFAYIAEFERNLIVERTRLGLEAARARGRVGGRKKGLSKDAQNKAEIAYNLYHSEQKKDKNDGVEKRSVDQLARAIGVSRRTFYNYVDWYENNAPEKQQNLL